MSLERSIDRIVTKAREVIAGTPTLSSEQRAVTYLDSLSEGDRANVTQFVGFARELRATVGVGIAIEAVGSTTKSESEGEFGSEAHDIDLRVMTATPHETPEREKAIQEVRSGIREYLQGQEVLFEESDYTDSHRMVECYSTDRDGSEAKGRSSFIDYNNSDPSFIAKPQEGLPLHIFISGSNKYDMSRHIIQEQKFRTGAVVLVKV